MKITDINDPRIPQWFKKAKKKNQKWYYDTKLNKIVWQDGVWEDGIWVYGTWITGTWITGTWKTGIWEHGWIYDPYKIGNYQKDWILLNDTFSSPINPTQYFKDTQHKITDINDPRVPKWFKEAQKKSMVWYYDTKLNKIVWKHGAWVNGTWQDGIWYYGSWKNGIWNDGIWQNGYWKDGTWQKGKWKIGWILDKDKIGNYQDDWKWDSDYVQSPINPAQYFKNSHIPKCVKVLLQKYKHVSDQLLLKKVDFDSVQQWQDQYFQTFSRQQFFSTHKDELSQSLSIYKLIRK